MADIDLTLKTTQVIIVSAFVTLTIYFNFVLVKTSLDVLFWASIASIPFVSLKNSTALISPYLSNLNQLTKRHALFVASVFGKIIFYDKNKNAFTCATLIALYIIIEKYLQKSKAMDRLKVFILSILIAIILAVTLNSILEEFKYIANTFNIKGFATEKNLKYMNDLISPNVEKVMQRLKNNNNVMSQLQKCGINFEKIKLSDIKAINFSESKNILMCLSGEYKKQLMVIANTSRPLIINALKKILVICQNSVSAISMFITFASTVYIMTKQSIQPIDVADAFLNLIDSTGYLSTEFKEIVNGLIIYYLQKIFVTGLSTFLTFSLFSMNIITIPTILSALTVLVPGAPTYLIPLIGIFELLFLQKPYWYVIIFIISCNRIKFFCDKMISLKVSTINRLYGGASMTLGVSAFGFKGIFIGPVLAAIPVIFWKLLNRQKGTSAGAGVVQPKSKK